MTGRRIALLLPRLSRYGGVEGFAYRLSSALAKDGHHIDFICARQETPPPDGVQAVVVGRIGLFRADKTIHYALAADRARRRGGYDLTIGLGKTIGQDVLRVSGGPLRLFWKLSERAYATGWDRGWKRFRRRLSPVGAVIARIEERQLRQAPRIIVVSHKTLEWLLEAYPWLDPAKVTVIYNRPDLERFKPCSREERDRARSLFGVGPDEIALTLAGTSFPRKGLGTVIGALPLLPDNHRLLVAGGRNPEIYVEQARRLGVADRVRFLGRVDDMESFYHASDVFTLPSMFDTCSNAILEALASGARVIGSVDDGSSYFLPERWRVQDPTDSQELAGKVRLAASEPLPEPFVWPHDVASGLDAYLEYVRNWFEHR